MKRLLVVALASAIAACGDPAEEADEPVAAGTATAAAPATVAAAASSAGTYEVTLADGTEMTAELKPDGTYEDKDAAGTVTDSGTWADREGETCFTPADGDPELCFTLGEPRGDGTRIAIPSDGSEPFTVRKIL